MFLLSSWYLPTTFCSSEGREWGRVGERLRERERRKRGRERESDNAAVGSCVGSCVHHPRERRRRHLRWTPHCTTLSLIPPVRSFYYYARTTVRSQGSSATVSRSDTIQLTQHFDFSARGLAPERALLPGAVSLSTLVSRQAPRAGRTRGTLQKTGF